MKQIEWMVSARMADGTPRERVQVTRAPGLIPPHRIQKLRSLITLRPREIADMRRWLNLVD